MVNENNNSKLIFEELLSRTQVERKLDPSVTENAKALVAASYFDDKKDIVFKARKLLMKENPRKLFFDFIKDIVNLVKTKPMPEKYHWANLLNDVAIQGLGIKIDDLEFQGINAKKEMITGEPRWDNIKAHIENNILGDFFIEKTKVPPDKLIWGEDFPLRISACDASQRRYKLVTPFNKFFSSPVVINNAAGVIKEKTPLKPAWKHIPVPKDTTDFENWVIIGYKDYTELNENDYEWATKSAMDVGEYYVEDTRIFNFSEKPDIHFRDGRIFPQDHALNCRLQNRHGMLTREAIYRMCSTLKKARELDILFCGVAKQVQLKIYSALFDWYIKRKMGEEKWNVTGHILTDTEVMRRILYNPKFDGSFKEVYTTCLVVRDFYTSSNLNRRTNKQVINDLNSLKDIYHNRTVTAKKIVDEALKYKVAMFFIGHCQSDEFYAPRYEFVLYDEDKPNINKIKIKLLSALRLASFDVDEDHLWGLEEPICTLVPTPILIAHDLSKKVGEDLAHNWISRTYAEFIKMRNDYIKNVAK